MLGWVEEVVFGFCLGFGLRSRDAALVGKNLIVVERQEFVDACSELFHVEYIATLNLSFDIVEVRGNSAFKRADFFLRQIILSDGDIRFQYASFGRILPCCQTHVRLCMVRSGMDDFCGSVPRDGIVKTILHHCVKLFGGRGPKRS